MKLSKNMIISTIVLSIVFGDIRYLSANQEVKWSEEAKIVVQGICASQYLDAKGLKGWSLNKLESEDMIGYFKVSYCAESFEKKYHPQAFFNKYKSDTDIIKIEIKTYLK